MKRIQYYAAVALGALGLVFGIACIVIGNSNENLREQLWDREADVREATSAQQRLNALLQDAGQVAINNKRVEELLLRNGFKLEKQGDQTSLVPVGSGQGGGGR